MLFLGGFFLWPKNNNALLFYVDEKSYEEINSIRFGNENVEKINAVLDETVKSQVQLIMVDDDRYRKKSFRVVSKDSEKNNFNSEFIIFQGEAFSKELDEIKELSDSLLVNKPERRTMYVNDVKQDNVLLVAALNDDYYRKNGIYDYQEMNLSCELMSSKQDTKEYIWKYFDLNAFSRLIDLKKKLKLENGFLFEKEASYVFNNETQTITPVIDDLRMHVAKKTINDCGFEDILNEVIHEYISKTGDGYQTLTVFLNENPKAKYDHNTNTITISDFSTMKSSYDFYDFTNIVLEKGNLTNELKLSTNGSITIKDIHIENILDLKTMGKDSMITVENSTINNTSVIIRDSKVIGLDNVVNNSDIELYGSDISITGSQYLESELQISNSSGELNELSFENCDNSLVVLNTELEISKTIFKENSRNINVGDGSSLDLRDSHLSNNFHALEIYSGAVVNSTNNTFENNHIPVHLDSTDSVFNQSKYQNVNNSYTNDKWFEKDLDSLIGETRIDGISSFSLGSNKAFIDQEHKVIYVKMDEDEFIHRLDFKTNYKDAKYYIDDTRYGNETDDYWAFTEVTTNLDYDFKSSFYQGTFRIAKDEIVDDYTLIISNSDLDMIQIDTKDIYRNVQEIPSEPKINANMVLYSSSDQIYTNQILPIKVETRGRIVSPKFKLGFKLENQFNLMGMSRSKDWVLESAFIDKTLMRPKLSFDMYRVLSDERESKKLAVESRYVELILNGEYKGVYLLHEHVDDDFLDIETSGFIARIENWNGNFSEKSDYFTDEGGFALKEGNKVTVSKMIDDYVDLVHSDDFYEEFQNKVDIESFVDHIIMMYILYDADATTKNTYFYSKSKDSKIHFVPWDKDATLGIKWNQKRLPYDGELKQTRADVKRFMSDENYYQLFLERLDEVLNTHLTPEVFEGMVESNHIRIEPALDRNFRLISIDDELFRYDTTYDEELTYLKDWYYNRVQYLKAYFLGEEVEYRDMGDYYGDD